MRRLILVLFALMSVAGPALAQEGRDSGAPAPAPAAPRKPAEVRAEQLDILFAKLYKSGGSEAAKGIEQKIWSLWSASDSPTAEVLLQQAARAMNDGAPKESLSILNRLTGSYPDFAEGWNKRATLYYMMKRDADSLSDIERVLNLEPRHFGALSGRGLILQRQKKYSAAMDAFREALAINPAMETIKSAVKELERLEQGI